MSNYSDLKKLLGMLEITFKRRELLETQTRFSSIYTKKWI